MTSQIWKYIITPNKLIHDVPKNGIIRHVDSQGDDMCVWIEVDPKASTEKRHFEVYGTGHSIKYGIGISRDYIGCVKMEGGALVFHVYESTGI